MRKGAAEPSRCEHRGRSHAVRNPTSDRYIDYDGIDATVSMNKRPITLIQNGAVVCPLSNTASKWATAFKPE